MLEQTKIIVKEAVEHYKKKQFELARIALEKALLSDANIGETEDGCLVFYMLGLVNFEQHNLVQANDCFKTTKKLATHPVMILKANLYVGVTDIKLKKLVDGCEALNAVLTTENVNRLLPKEILELANFHFAKALFFQNKYEEALLYIDEALKLSKQLESSASAAQLYLEKGLTLYHIGNYFSAIEALKLAYQGMPSSSECLAAIAQRIGLCYFKAALENTHLIGMDEAMDFLENSITHFTSLAKLNRNMVLNMDSELLASEFILGLLLLLQNKKTLMAESCFKKINQAINSQNLTLQIINAMREVFNECVTITFLERCPPSSALESVCRLGRMLNREESNYSPEINRASASSSRLFSRRMNGDNQERRGSRTPSPITSPMASPRMERRRGE